MFLTTGVKLNWKERNYYWCACHKDYSLALELCLLGWHDSQCAYISLFSPGQAWARTHGKGDRSSPSTTLNKLKDSDTLFGTRLQKASTLKDLLSQKMLHNFMSSSQARQADTSDRITSLTFSGAFLFCTPIHTSVTEAPVCFFTMVSQCYHHAITLSHFIPMAVTVSADIWICQHKLLWNCHGKLLWNVSRPDLATKDFLPFFFF